METYIIISAAGNFRLDRRFLEGIEGMTFNNLDEVKNVIKNELREREEEEQYGICPIWEFMTDLNDDDDSMDTANIKENFYTYVYIA